MDGSGKCYLPPRPLLAPTHLNMVKASPDISEEILHLSFIHLNKDKFLHRLKYNSVVDILLQKLKSFP